MMRISTDPYGDYKAAGNLSGNFLLLNWGKIYNL